MDKTRSFTTLYEVACMYHQLSSFGWFVEPALSQTPSAAKAARQTGASEAGLPPPSSTQELLSRKSIFDCLQERQSKREYQASDLAIDKITALLWSGYGQVGMDENCERRTVPSAGALFPLQIYLAAANVEGLDREVFEYQPHTNTLEHCINGKVPKSLSSWFYTQHVDLDNSGAIIFLAARINNCCARYGERGYRYLLLEAGHVAQNICLCATALDISVIPLGGFDDTLVNKMVCAEGEVVLYSIVVGNALLD